MTTTPAGQLLELDARRRVTLGRLANHDRYTAHLMPNGSILLEPAILVSPDEAAMLRSPEFMALLQRRIDDTEAGLVDRVDLAAVRAEIDSLPD